MTGERALVDLRNRAKDEKPITWVFLGDSITHGGYHTFGQRDYVQLFAERVRQQLWRTADAIINMAVGGYRVPNVLGELEHRCFRFQPDVVAVALGVNDSVSGMDAIGKFEEDYFALVEKLRKGTSAHIFLQTLSPVPEGSRPDLSAYPAYVDVIRRVAAETGLPLCDHYRVWEDYTKKTGRTLYYLLSDPVHPNGFGCRLIADTLLTWLGYGPLVNGSPLDGFQPEP